MVYLVLLVGIACLLAVMPVEGCHSAILAALAPCPCPYVRIHAPRPNPLTYCPCTLQRDVRHTLTVLALGQLLSGAKNLVVPATS